MRTNCAAFMRIGRLPIATIAVIALLASALAAAPAAASAASYIVVYQDGVNASAKAAALGVTPTHVYTAALDGFAASLTTAQLAAVNADPQKRLVSLNGSVPGSQLEWSLESSNGSLQKAQVTPASVRRVGANLSATADIDGVDERVDIDVAVIDGGMNYEHPDLNVVGVYNCNNSSYTKDGHGTHVAGTIGALDNGSGVVGVAPGARIWSVRVLNNKGTSTFAEVICGVDWVTAHADVIDVANMSLQYTVVDDENCGLTNSDAFHLAVCNAYGAGVTLVSAAGNHASDASGTAPGTFEETINVSAFNDFDGLPGALGSPTCSKKFGADDTFASYSNYGADIDISAPGTCVLSAWGNGKYNESTGTSMAAPHVTGGAALYLANHPYASPADVKSALLAAAAGESFPGDPDGTAEPRVNVASL